MAHHIKPARECCLVAQADEQTINESQFGKLCTTAANRRLNQNRTEQIYLTIKISGRPHWRR